MCLAKVFTDSEMAEWLEDQPEVIEVWKGVGSKSGTFTMWDIPSNTGYNGKPYPFGWGRAFQNKIRIGSCNYYSGFHFCIAKQETKKRFSSSIDGNVWSDITIIRCLIKKEWITAIGAEGGAEGNKIVIVASQAVFPHYPETEARLEDLPKEITHHSSEAQGAGAKQAPNFAL